MAQISALCRGEKEGSRNQPEPSRKKSVWSSVCGVRCCVMVVRGAYNTPSSPSPTPLYLYLFLGRPPPTTQYNTVQYNSVQYGIV